MLSRVVKSDFWWREGISQIKFPMMKKKGFQTPPKKHDIINELPLRCEWVSEWVSYRVVPDSLKYEKYCPK